MILIISIFSILSFFLGYYIGWKESIYVHNIDEKQEREHRKWSKTNFKIKGEKK